MSGYFEFSVTYPFTKEGSEKSSKNLAIISLKDTRTNFIIHTIIPNTKIPIASLLAYQGARFSRCPFGTIEIINEIAEKHIDTDSRTGAITSYGHGSVAEMAPITVSFEGIPDYYGNLILTESSFYAGQQGSTRFIDFSANATLVPLQYYLDIAGVSVSDESLHEEFIQYQELLLEKFNYWVKNIRQKFSEYFEIDNSKKSQTDALEARTLDTARGFLPKGLFLRTDVYFQTQAREFSRIISFLLARQDKGLQYLGEQLNFLLDPDLTEAERIGYIPEAAQVIRHTKANETTSITLQKLKEFLVTNLFIQGNKASLNFHRFQKVEYLNLSFGEITALQSILMVYPYADPSKTISFLRNLTIELKETLSKIIFQSFDCYNQMSHNGRVNGISFEMLTTFAEWRDWARHRPWSRFVPEMYSENYHNINTFILPAYLTEIPEFSEFKLEFVNDILHSMLVKNNFQLKALKQPNFPVQVLNEMGLFCEATRVIMSGSPANISYTTSRRVKPGGHINYRILAHEMALEASQSDPLLFGLALNTPRPNPASREEFLSRK